MRPITEASDADFLCVWKLSCPGKRDRYTTFLINPREGVQKPLREDQIPEGIFAKTSFAGAWYYSYVGEGGVN
jgi:hypothetical protein